MPAKLDDAVFGLMKDAAEKLILPKFRLLERHEVRDKSVGELVTTADLEAEAFLSDALAKLLPEAKIVGEEAASEDAAMMKQLSEDLCWIIDPLDGTNNFANGTGPFGIMVALTKFGEVIGGWILDPLTGRRCSASLGSGSRINGEKVFSKASGQTPKLLAMSSLYGSVTDRELLRHAFEGIYQLSEIPRCAAEQYPRMTLGQSDITLFGRTLAWDHAAGSLFVSEAGGYVARKNGDPYRVDQTGSGLIVATDHDTWEQFAVQLNECEQVAKGVLV